MESDVFSTFYKAESAESSEEKVTSKVAPVKQEASEKKQLDEAVMKQSSSAQKKIIKRIFQTDSFGKAYNTNARSKPVLFVPDKRDSVVYKSISAMRRVSGLSKARLIGKTKF